ncbi:thiol:disulfide interchange protein DsbA/DsbL [Pseudidiomarina terrestris]|uniref:Thiol:disulfide interchange protein n=1 Tax=Pseudidiomarina terrestris TaxID=2820060 RepID=A0AAW7R3G6_9GAMM|nr:MULTISPECIES: thiol:disulfide interchange protein DsbA/DsbL [unclassified Pseudidiomarina]MDN7125296.1 thiol:disulfide interchange protein DsbA/DsbL [Pseudidiomarina sp. 1APP75-32.1]MDN7127900.1 thiol:disulfide interchange protein DsbA/DsbL [Pseudidiomarina sp. 1APR75-33.1]MDN7130055.1 thiol:disulfide interchange protein DsbA/DsbL [Pseudidiomarina sp. 1APR75-15]MDN7135560.1 thiol:disulfide interchange protein DsbA/DsbL [Pseudidiomarina sp. 1ASP75-5]MDN7137402.1 thiol:disulfide interchange p
MKKMLFAVLALMMFPAAAQQFEEGVHYEVIAEQGTEKPEIKEFFSFFCGACYRFEPIAQAMSAEYPEAFEKSHVSFINYKGQGMMMNQAWALAEQLDKDKEIAAAIFQRNFVQNNMIGSMEDFEAVFATNGVSKEDFNKMINSFAVRGMANKMDREAANYGVNSTPTFIVNGKYRLLPQGFSESENFADDFIAAAGYLLEK